MDGGFVGVEHVAISYMLTVATAQRLRSGACELKVVRLETADAMEKGLHTDSTRATGEVAVNGRPCAL